MEVEAEFLAEAKLQKVIIQRLLGHFDFFGSVFEWPPLKLVLARLRIRDYNAVIKLTPCAHFFNDFLNGSLLCPLAFLLLRAIACSWKLWGRILIRCTGHCGRIHLWIDYLLCGCWFLSSGSRLNSWGGLCLYPQVGSLSALRSIAWTILPCHSCVSIVAIIATAATRVFVIFWGLILLCYANRFLIYFLQVASGRRWSLWFYMHGATIVCILVPRCSLAANDEIAAGGRLGPVTIASAIFWISKLHIILSVPS